MAAIWLSIAIISGKIHGRLFDMGGSSRLTLNCNNGPALYLELRGNGVTHKAPYINFGSNSSFGIVHATGPGAAIKIVSPSGTKHTGSVLSLDRFSWSVALRLLYPISLIRCILTGISLTILVLLRWISASSLGLRCTRIRIKGRRSPVPVSAMCLI